MSRNKIYAFFCFEGGLLFFTAGIVDDRTDNGAVDLNGGTWSGDLKYGTFTAETWKNSNLYCSDQGKLTRQGS